MEQSSLLIKTSCQNLSTFFLIRLEKLINIHRPLKSEALQYELHEIGAVSTEIYSPGWSRTSVIMFYVFISVANDCTFNHEKILPSSNQSLIQTAHSRSSYENGSNIHDCTVTVIFCVLFQRVYTCLGGGTGIETCPISGSFLSRPKNGRV